MENKKIIFSDYGIDLLKTENNRYYLSYDAGGIGSKEITVEITLAEFIQAQKSEQDAYLVILETQKRNPI